MNYIIMAFILFLYWELTGIFFYTWISVRAWMQKFDIDSSQYTNKKKFFKTALIYGPLLGVFYLLMELISLKRLLFHRKQ